MTQPVVAPDKVVSLTYVLRNARNEIFEYRDLPVSYLHGAGSELFPKIEAALEGHAVGDRVTVNLTPEESFGAHDPGLTFTDDIENVPPELRRLGAEVAAENAKGEQILLYVTRIADGKLTVDANHPLAGQHVTFEVTISDIRDATAEEQRNGQPAAAAYPVQ